MNLKKELEKRFPGNDFNVEVDEEITNIHVNGELFGFGFVIEEKNFVSCLRFIIEEIEHDIEDEETNNGKTRIK